MDKIDFKNGQSPYINADNLNKIQENAETAIDENKNYVDEQIDNISTGMPIGSGCDFFGTIPPTNFLFADGRAISRVEYAELFDIIGTTYGIGDGETTFNLPDKRERVSVGFSANSENGTSGATFGILGALGGVLKHVHKFGVTLLNYYAMPSFVNTNTGALAAGDKDKPVGWTKNGELVGVRNNSLQTSTTNNTLEKYYSSADTSEGTTLQPYIVCNYIIKVK